MRGALQNIIRVKAEEAKTRGTPVTRESFLAWKVKFDKEMTVKRVKEQEEKSKNLTPKERDEHRKFQGRQTGLIISLSPCKPQLKSFQASKSLNVVETGLRMNHSRRTERLSTLPSTNALTKPKKRTKGTVSISAIVIKDNQNIDVYISPMLQAQFLGKWVRSKTEIIVER